MKILTIVGARPQFIKLAAVSRLIRAKPNLIEILVHTGQHYDENLSGQFFTELTIPKPDYNLGIGSGTHGKQTGKMLESIEIVLLAEKPDKVLVYGDTNSTLAGALAASKLHISVAHVEAGLRSFNRQMPEEINRLVTDHVAEYLFAPTITAVNNLQREGIESSKIHLVGDVMYDAMRYYSEKAELTSQILEKLKLTPKTYLLATIHRAENTDNAACLTAIFQALMELSKNLSVILPLHPRTRAALQQIGLFEQIVEKLQLIEPIGYLDMLQLQKQAKVIATDSGGMQKEAFFQQVPCVTLRTETEWTELVELGWNQLVTPDNPRMIVDAIQQHSQFQGKIAFPYGTGQAAQHIITILEKH